MQSVQQILEATSARYRGPGGAVAVVKDGELLGQHVWGYADMDKRILMEPTTMMPICSISKQMLCAVLLDLERNPPPAVASRGPVREQLQNKLREMLPPGLCESSGLTIQHLCDNQSGIRDYWALTTLWGAKPEDAFSLDTDAPGMRARIKSLHFEPGSRYSYANTNFHILARLVESVTGQPLGELLRERVFGPADMATARLCADTAAHPPPCVGYEGDERRGFLPARNRIEWSGDAGVVASLEDMVAYEKHLDRLWRQAAGPGGPPNPDGAPLNWYQTAAQRQHVKFSDGRAARYRYGLGHTVIEGTDLHAMGHGGGLRGFHLQRLHQPSGRLSVVALFNHGADAGGATRYILREVLGLGPPAPPRQPGDPDPVPGWFGDFLDPETMLLAAVRPGAAGEVAFTFAGDAETLRVEGSGGETDGDRGARAVSRSMVASINGDTLSADRFLDNLRLTAVRLTPRESSRMDATLQGTYRCDEIESVFYCSGQGDMRYGSFDGPMGKGPVLLMRYVGDDVWAIACPRGLDEPAPGDWTVVFHRDERNAVTGFTVGCWLARKLQFTKV